MKKILLIAAAFALPGCAALTAMDAAVSILKPADAVGDKVILEGTRGLVLAHNAYQAAAATASAAVRSGRLSPAQVDKIEAANAKALEMLNSAEGTLSTTERVAAILNATNDIILATGGQ
jgi:hypothetical protein